MKGLARISLVTLSALLVLSGLCGCGGTTPVAVSNKAPSTAPTMSGETELPFETVEFVGNDVGGSYREREPRLVVVTTRQEIDRIEGLVSSETLAQLKELDFQQYFVIGLYRGSRGSSGYATIIERIARREDKIVVYAQFWEPSPHYVVFDTVTSPYHLVKVRKERGMSEETKVVLNPRVVTPTPPFR